MLSKFLLFVAAFGLSAATTTCESTKTIFQSGNCCGSSDLLKSVYPSSGHEVVGFVNSLPAMFPNASEANKIYEGFLGPYGLSMTSTAPGSRSVTMTYVPGTPAYVVVSLEFDTIQNYKAYINWRLCTGGIPNATGAFAFCDPTCNSDFDPQSCTGTHPNPYGSFFSEILARSPTLYQDFALNILFGQIMPSDSYGSKRHIW